MGGLVSKPSGDDNNKYVVFFTQAVAQANLGNHVQATRLYQTAIALERNDPVLFFNCGVSRARRQKYQDALSDFNKAIDLSPDYSEAFYN
jgi:Flp pilus assembly protein TadD